MDSDETGESIEFMESDFTMKLEDEEITVSEPPPKKYSIPKETLRYLNKLKKEKKIATIKAVEKAEENKLIVQRKINDGLKTENSAKVNVQNPGKSRSSLSVDHNLIIDCDRKKGEPTVRSVLYKYSQHSEKGWYICPKEGCNFRSRHSKNVYTHDKKHTGERKYCCPTCGKTFILLKNYKLHALVHTNVKNFACQKCPKKFRNKNNLERHFLTHTEDKPYPCEICHCAYRDKVNLKRHIASKHTPEEDQQKCKIQGCNFVAIDENSLKKHEEKHVTETSDTALLKCNICDKILYRERSMWTHMLKHKGTKHNCQYCSYTTVFKHALQAHCMRKHHRDLEGNEVERNYKCTHPKCEFATFWEHELKFHLAKHEDKETYPFKCPICDYSTILKDSMLKHMRLHTGEQPFVCNICGQSYTNQSGLARHRRVHTGEKPYSCDTCGHKYADLKTLRVHSLSHRNIKPFICSFCPYSCTKKEVLVSHFRRAHADVEIAGLVTNQKQGKGTFMRVTSGQSATDIVYNIAPYGIGERKFVKMNEKSNSCGVEFKVIHENNFDGKNINENLTEDDKDDKTLSNPIDESYNKSSQNVTETKFVQVPLVVQDEKQITVPATTLTAMNTVECKHENGQENFVLYCNENVPEFLSFPISDANTMIQINEMGSQLTPASTELQKSLQSIVHFPVKSEANETYPILNTELIGQIKPIVTQDSDSTTSKKGDDQ